MKTIEDLKDKECIIFDFDGTIGNIIIDWEDWRKKLYEIIKKYDSGFTGSFQEVRFSKENDYFKKYGKDFRKEVLLRSEDYEQENITDIVANEPIIFLIKSLKNKRLFLWTSNTLVGIEKYLFNFGIRDSFEKIITGNDIMYKKPNREGFYLIKEEKYPLSSYVLIGDSIHDKNAAENSGIDFINVSEFL